MKTYKQVNCISDLLNTVNEFNEKYSNFFFGTTPASTKFLYRGISNSANKLMPVILRKTSDVDITINKAVENDLYLNYGTEVDIIKDFIAHACAFIKQTVRKLRNYNR
ncbi:MAG: hypothetical protein JW811_03190 [Clostridiales bacterium]|nr:hypothetical protein [Clostridiales bacterium]